ncbi:MULTISPECIES: hypothetical protein [unclassified Massilia]|uniref:WapI family immunity protein n=1 Tax=unclassified Massilia TaxID=2609279 RepID=UPI0017830D1C|nr:MULTISPECIES: hypothetical protein [unclassified Massilia]MBD8530718.1 hypothetical protein [Massilia sp. CFBP 13647]MBD8676444.1 hypothetical protein [Massilia sp. CFBP 13721]
MKLWIHGYQSRDCNDYWDGNWLNATAICSEGGATVLVQAFSIRNDELFSWQRAVEKPCVHLAGEANLEYMEPELGVTLKAKPLGAVEMEVNITSNNLTQEHSFQFSIDQSYLKPLSSQCARVLDAFPIRGA